MAFKRFPSLQAIFLECEIRKECMRKCDYVSKSLLNKAAKRASYEKLYLTRDILISKLELLK